MYGVGPSGISQQHVRLRAGSELAGSAAILWYGSCRLTSEAQAFEPRPDLAKRVDLYTAKILADVERETNAPIATRFDLIAGTSIGGILALAAALEIPAQIDISLCETRVGSMTFTVIVDPEAKADLLRLYEHLLERAQYVEDLETADCALQAIEAAMSSLSRAPFLAVKVARPDAHRPAIPCLP